MAAKILVTLLRPAIHDSGRLSESGRDCVADGGNGCRGMHCLFHATISAVHEATMDSAGLGWSGLTLYALLANENTSNVLGRHLSNVPFRLGASYICMACRPLSCLRN